MSAATDWINQQEASEKHYAIFTDSKSLIDALQSNKWKDSHEWIRVVKKNLSEMEKKLTICWVPSHCAVYGNEKADQLAEEGTKQNQKEAPVTFGIVKAKIRSVKWEITHKRAKETFEERRRPLAKEQEWPARVRRVYSRIRSGHAKELRAYRKKIKMEDSDTCIFCELDEPETIEHLICRCSHLEARRLALGGEFKMGTMTSDPEKCRKLLASRIKQLNLKEEVENNESGGSPSGCVGPQA